MNVETGAAERAGEFFPPRFWGLDPLFSAKLKLRIRDVLSLSPYPEYPGVYCIGNHPVLGVHVMGDVVSVREKSALITYEIDDGSGVLSCVQWRRTKDSSEGLYVASLGQLVSVLGQAEEFREERQLRVTAIIAEEDPSAEPCHWLQVEAAWRSVYCQRFTLPAGVIETEGKTERRSVKEAVRESLMTYLDSKATPFTISSLITSEEVMSAVWEGVRGEVGEGQRAEVERELRVLAKSLPESGLVVPAQECPSSTYEVLCERRHLYPVILDFIRHKLCHPRVAHCGVPRQWIVEHVQGRERLRQVPAATVTTAISHMEEESVIFSVSEGAYKTVS